MTDMQQQLNASTNQGYSHIYVEGEEYTNENYQLCIKNVPHCIPPIVNDLERIMRNQMQLNPRKFTTLQGLQPKKHDHCLRVHFSSEEQRQKALKAINEYQWSKGWSRVHAELIGPNVDPRERNYYRFKKSMMSADNLTVPQYIDPTLPPNREKNDVTSKKPLPDFKSLDDAVKYSISPLWNVPYEKQLKGKKDEAEEILRQMSSQLSEANPDAAPCIKEKTEKFNGLPCEFLGIINDRNKAEGYRRNVTLTFGQHNNEKVLGFLAEGTTKVAPIPADLVNIPKKMKETFQIFENYVKRSEFDVYDPETNTGHWEAFTLQYSDTLDESLAIAKINNLSKKDRKTKIKPELLAYFSRPEIKGHAPTSLFLQIEESWKVKPFFFQIIESGKIKNKTFNNLELQITKRAFFRENAELVYQAVRDVSELNKSINLLELGCGIGTIGLALSKEVNYVYGVDNCQISLSDASKNQQLNNSQNSQYFWGPEQPKFSFLPKDSPNDLVVIIDTHRFELTPEQVDSLRQLKNLKKVVFLSCNATALSLMQTFPNFFCPPSEAQPTSPFIPCKAVAVDTLPHTLKFDLVICFERMREAAASAGVKRGPSIPEVTEPKRPKAYY
nr:PREDICTED: tRNA (uracil-5-)-methyltransferase homolog A-like [Bemisia tabaci]